MTLLDLQSLLADLAFRYGYPGVFTVSFLGSVIPFLPLPYLAVVILLSGTTDPVTIGIVSGMGGSLGKVTSYLIGRGGYRLSGPRTTRNLDALRGIIGKYGTLGVFIFAITPLPDDIYIVPIGMMKFSFWKFFIANTAGKVALAILVAYLSRSYFGIADVFVGENQLIAVIGAIAVTFLVSVLLLKADWQLAVTVFKNKGIRGLLASLPDIFSSKRDNR